MDHLQTAGHCQTDGTCIQLPPFLTALQQFYPCSTLCCGPRLRGPSLYFTLTKLTLVVLASVVLLKRSRNLCPCGQLKMVPLPLWPSYLLPRFVIHPAAGCVYRVQRQRYCNCVVEGWSFYYKSINNTACLVCYIFSTGHTAGKLHKNKKRKQNKLSKFCFCLLCSPFL